MIRRSSSFLALSARSALVIAGVALFCAAVPTQALAKEKPAAGEDQPDAKPEKKTSKPDAKKTDPKKPADSKQHAEGKKTIEGKKTPDSKKPDAKDEKSVAVKETKTAKDAKEPKDKEPKNGQDAKNSKNNKDKVDKEKGAAKAPVPVGSYGDWNALTAHGQGKDRTCYALAEPKDRQPAKLQRDKAYVFISTRPSEGVRNEVAVIMGFPLKDGGSATADIDGDNFELVTKGTNAWVKNPAKEKEFVEALKSGGKLVVKAPSAKGNVTTDTYSLKGLSDALSRVQKECP